MLNRVARPRPAAGAAALVAAYLLADALLPNGLPLGIVLFGVVLGLLNALGAIGLILVYRAGRYVNFAQASFGAAGAVLAFRLVNAMSWNWFAAVGLGLLVSVLLALLSELLFVQRLFTAPRLILTVATIGIAQFVAFFELGFSLIEKKGVLVNRYDPPFDFAFRVSGVVFGAAHVMVLVVVPAIIVALAVFFVRSRYGAVVQAAAENSDRARLLGISVRSISTLTWVTVGLLSGVTAILQTPVVGVTLGANAGPALLLRALAPAMLARLERLPTAVGAALVLGVVEQAMAYNFSASGPIEVVLFLAILAALALRRQVRGRTTEGEERSFAVATVVRPVPRELARVPAVAIARRVALAVPVAVAILVPARLSLSQQNLATALVVYVIAALSVTVLTGYAGQVSLGQWALVGLGALLGGALASRGRLGFELGLVLVPLAGAALALLIGVPALRIRGVFLGVTTLGFAIAAHAWLFQQPFFALGDFVLRPGWVRGELAYYYFTLGVLALCMLGLRNLRRSAVGRAMVAVRDNDRAAASYGVDLVRAKLSAFAASGFLAALAGYLYVYNAQKLDAGGFPPLTSLLLFSAVVIGGLGSQTGAVLGALYFRGVSYFLPGWMQFLTTSVGLLLILLFLPGGLGSLVFGVRDALLRRYALARGIRVPSLVADTLEHPAAGTARPAAGPELVAAGTGAEAAP